MAFNVELPNGKVLANVPDGASKQDIINKAVSSGLAVEQDFAGAGEKFLIGMGAGFARFGEGITQLALGLGEKVGVVDEGSTAEYTERVKKTREFFSNTGVGQSTAGKVGSVVGETAPSMLIPGGVAGKFSKRLLTSALSNSAAETLRFTEDPSLFSGERFRNAAGGALVGGAGTAALASIPAAGRFIKSTADELTAGGAQRKIKGVVGLEDIRGEATDAAEGIGVWLTPGEASGRADLKAFERGLSVDTVDDFSKTIAARISDRSNKIKETLDDVIQQIGRHSPEDATKIAKGYADLSNLRISSKFYQNLEQQPFIKGLWNKMQNTPEYAAELSKIPPNSAARLDTFKNFLWERSKKMKKAQKSKAAKVVDDFRVNLVNQLDTMVPSYSEARGLAQLNIAQRKMNKGLAKTKGRVRSLDGGSDVDVMQFYRNTFKSDQDFADLMEALSSVPAAQKKLTQVRTVLNAIEGSGINNIFTKSKDAVKTKGTAGLGVQGAVGLSGLEFLQGRHNKALVDYITNPNYTADLLESVKPTKLRKLSGETYRVLTKVLTRIGSANATPEATEQRQATATQ